MTSTWRSLNADDIPVIAQITDIVEATAEPLAVAATAADTAADALAVLADLLEVFAGLDPSAALRALINELIDLLLNNKVSTLVIKPQLIQPNRYKGFDGFVRTIRDSMYDSADIERPNLEFDATISGAVFMFSAPSFAELGALVSLFSSFFGDGWQEIADIANSLPGRGIPQVRLDATGTVTGFPDGADPRSAFIDETQAFPSSVDLYSGSIIQGVSGLNVAGYARIESYEPVTGTFTLSPGFRYDLKIGDAYMISHALPGTAPDWKTVRVSDVVPPIAQAAEALARVRDQLGPNTGIATLLSELADLIARKAALLAAIAEELAQLAETIANLGDLTNINFLPIAPRVGGDVGFLEELAQADNRPNIAPEAFTGGLVVYGGSELATILALLFGPFFS